MDIVIPAPVPLPEPGQYTELPPPQWKLRPYQVATDAYAAGKVYSIMNIPIPVEWRQVYQTIDLNTVKEAKEYVDWAGTDDYKQPEWMKKIQPCPEGRLSTQRKVLEFDDLFEGGNLHSAYAISDTEYNLYLSPDTNSKGHIQWFFFSVRTRVPVKAKFNIMNFMKPKCLFSNGMRPSYSSGGKGLDAPWTKVPGSCLYYLNGFSYEPKPGKTVDLYTLSFEFDFQSPASTVYFAFSPPYTVSDLRHLLHTVESSDLRAKSIAYKRVNLCVSALGLPVDHLTITSTSPKALLPRSQRKIVVLSARVHSGEVPGSIIMHELISFLTLSKSPEAKSLRELYVFHLIPILNPDGVVLGNSRTGIEGVDMNRRWQKEECDDFPQIQMLKNLLKSLQSEGRVSLFCDLHGHAKRNNAFVYGCSRMAEGFAAWTKVRLFPRVLAKVSSYFNYQECNFKVQKEKIGTGRVVAWQELGVTNSFTLETSFHGYIKDNEVLEFTKTDLFSFADDILFALLQYHPLEADLGHEIETNGGRLKPGQMKGGSGTLALVPLQIQDREEFARFKFAEMLSNLSNCPEGLSSRKKTNIRLVFPKEVLKSAKSITFKRDKNDFSARGKALKRVVGNGGKTAISWREYFNLEELANTFEAIKSGKYDEERDFSGSESAPSDDQLERTEISALNAGRIQPKTALFSPSLERSVTVNDRLIPSHEEKKSESEKNLTPDLLGNRIGEISPLLFDDKPHSSMNFIRSQENFLPGKPQDFLFTKSPFSRTMTPRTILPVSPKRTIRRNPENLNVEKLTKTQKKLLSSQWLVIETRTERREKMRTERGMEEGRLAFQRKNKPDHKSQIMSIGRFTELKEFAFPGLRGTKIPTAQMMFHRTVERLSSIVSYR